MAQILLGTLLDGLEVFRPALTRPGFDNFVILFCGWVLTMGQHAVTQALVATRVAGRRHHEAFHRFFSRGAWDPDCLGFWLWQKLERVIPSGAIGVVLDDTLAPKKGPHVFGIGSHLDPVRSTKLVRVFCFGHCWVMLAVLLRVPFSRRPWALPLLFRLYRNKKDCIAKRQRYRKKTELGREMLDVFRSWTGERRIELAADAAYCNDTVIRGLPDSMVLFGAMRPDALLTEAPEPLKPGQKGGRPRKRGALLPKPEALARDERVPWNRCDAQLYGHKRRVRYKEMTAQWYRACGVRLLRIVVVKVSTGSIGLRVFFCTDPKLSVVAILEGYAGRWAIESCFRNLKQLLGFADSQARKRAAVERVAPFVGLSYTFLVLWFVEHAFRRGFAVVPLRPWYLHKQGFSFADVLRTAQRVLAPLDVLDPRRRIGNLRQRLPCSSRRANCNYASYTDVTNGESRVRIHDGNIRTAEAVRFIRQLRRQLGTKLLLVWDRLNVHRSATKILQRRADLPVEWLPAYAPDLNPVEQIWNRSKYTELANYIAQDIDDLHGAVAIALAIQTPEQDLLRGYFKHAGLFL